MIERPRRWKFTVQDKDRHGNVRTYLRLPGKPKVRLHETPGTDAFEAEYRRAIDAKPVPPKAPVRAIAPGSVDALVVAYYGSAAFRAMDERSQRVRRGILDRFRMAHGDKPAARLEARHLVQIRDARADTPEAANGLLKALRAAFRHGVEAGLVADNPAARVAYLPSANPDGFHAWTMAEVERFEAAYPVGTLPRLALALLLYTGQRRSDVVALGTQHLRDGVLTFTQVKGRRRKPVRLSIPVIPELQRIIDATPLPPPPKGSAIGALAFLRNQAGKAYTPDGFGNQFRRWCRAAGLPECSPHGLRKAAASRLAELGCSAHEIMAVTGHRTLKEVDRYTREAAQRVMAQSAMKRMAEDAAGKEKVPPGAGTPEWDETAAQPLDQKGYEECMVPRAGIEPATLRFSVACSTN